jgi:hypothetical protein
VGYPPPVFVNFEVGVAIFLHIIEDHYLNDLLQIIQFSSKWQLAAFYNNGGMVIMELPEYSLRKLCFES